MSTRSKNLTRKNVQPANSGGGGLDQDKIVNVCVSGGATKLKFAYKQHILTQSQLIDAFNAIPSVLAAKACSSKVDYIIIPDLAQSASKSSTKKVGKHTETWNLSHFLDDFLNPEQRKMCLHKLGIQNEAPQSKWETSAMEEEEEEDDQKEEVEEQRTTRRKKTSVPIIAPSALIPAVLSSAKAWIDESFMNGIQQDPLRAFDNAEHNRSIVKMLHTAEKSGDLIEVVRYVRSMYEGKHAKKIDFIRKCMTLSLGMSTPKLTTMLVHEFCPPSELRVSALVNYRHLPPVDILNALLYTNLGAQCPWIKELQKPTSILIKLFRETFEDQFDAKQDKDAVEIIGKIKQIASQMSVADRTQRISTARYLAAEIEDVSHSAGIQVIRHAMFPSESQWEDVKYYIVLLGDQIYDDIMDRFESIKKFQGMKLDGVKQAVLTMHDVPMTNVVSRMFGN